MLNIVARLAMLNEHRRESIPKKLKNEKSSRLFRAKIELNRRRGLNCPLLAQPIFYGLFGFLNRAAAYG